MNGRIRAVMIGHAVADALGVPVEFSSREELKQSPVTDMRGYGAYPVPAGSWSDDTSMALCALDRLRGSRVDYRGIMRNFSKWINEGAFTPGGVCFDRGGICSRAVERFSEGIPPLECGLDGEYSNGNGSLMRIHPFALRAYFTGLKDDEAIELVERGSALTHAHPRSLMGCGIYSFVLWALLDRADKDSVRRGLAKAREYYRGHSEMKAYERLFADIGGLGREGDGVVREIGDSEILSTGYVVDSLEAAIYCLLNTDGYAECVLRAVNLGGDTDTVGAIAGGLAGALYGYDAIPERWRSALIKGDHIEKTCKRAEEAWS